MVIVKPELEKKLIAEIRGRVLSNLGYKNRIAPNNDIEKILSESIAAVYESSNPRGIYVLAPIAELNKKEIITEPGAIRSPMFARLAGLCKGKRAMVFMIATIGDEWKLHLGQNDSVLRQFLFDTVASEAVELAAELVEKQWRDEAESKGLKATMRFSPGYCDWDLREQSVIFNGLDSRKIGVEITKHYVMIPEKTISAVALIAEEVGAVAPCAFCLKDCRWRKIPYQLKKGG